MVDLEKNGIYKVFFEHALNAMFVFNNQAEILATNQVADNLLGFSMAGLKNKSMWELIPKKYLRLAQRDWRNFLKKGEQEGIFSIINIHQQVYHTEYRAVANVIPGLHIATLRDITARVDMQSELELSEARYKYLTSIYPVGIFHADAEGNNIYVNEKATEIMDTTFEAAMGNGWAKNLHPDDASWIIEAWDRAIHSQERINLEYRFLHEDGSIIWVKGQTVPEYDSQGGIIGHVGTLTDITKLHEAEEKIRQNQIEIAHYSRVITMGEIVSGIAHELNQPLTAIVNYANGCIRRMQNNNIYPEITDSIKQIASQAERAGAIIHHLKDFLRKGAPRISNCNVNECIQNAINMLRGTVVNQLIEIKTDLEADMPDIRADNISIEQVIINLINNAVEAMHERKNINKIIRIASYSAGTRIFIEIEDNGPGVAKHIEDNLFNPFVTTKKDGMGIGLSLSRNIIETYNGKLTYHAVSPHGSLFLISLPKHKEINRK